MTINEAIELLKQHNKWRRGFEKTPMTNPTDLGIAIDTIVKHYEKQKKNEKV